MIDVKEAVETATAAAQEFYSGKDLRGLDLEEVEFIDDEQCWYITLGFLVPDPNPPRGLAALGIPAEKRFERKYKVFKIDGTRAKVLSMKIRET